MNQRTKRDIVLAFNNLIQRHEFDQITVSDITKEALISKATFYRYFKDKYEVMNENYKQLLDELSKNPSCESYKDLYFGLFSIGRHSWKPMKYAFMSTGVNSFEHFIYTYSKQLVLDITMQNRGYGFSPQEDLQIDVFCSGISVMYKKYIMEEYPMSAEDAAEALFSIMPETLKYYYYK